MIITPYCPPTPRIVASLLMDHTRFEASKDWLAGWSWFSLSRCRSL